MRELCLDGKEIGLQSHALHHLLARLAVELLKKVDARAQRLSTAFCLRDSVIKAPHLVDDRVPPRAHCSLAASVPTCAMSMPSPILCCWVRGWATLR